jgi:hypothetical protein
MKKSLIAKHLLIVGAITVFGLTTVGAASVYKTVKAVIRPDFTVTLDEQTLSFKDGNGKTVNPLIVDGSTYLCHYPIMSRKLYKQQGISRNRL